MNRPLGALGAELGSLVALFFGGAMACSSSPDSSSINAPDGATTDVPDGATAATGGAGGASAGGARASGGAGGRSSSGGAAGSGGFEFCLVCGGAFGAGGRIGSGGTGTGGQTNGAGGGGAGGLGTGGSGGTTQCPNAAPTTTSPCKNVPAPCFYEDCGGVGRVTARCTNGVWALETGACGAPTCGPGSTTCMAGQACVVRAGGAVYANCTANHCGGGPVQCDCIEGCSPGCFVTGSVHGGISVSCNTCPGGGCP